MPTYIRHSKNSETTIQWRSLTYHHVLGRHPHVELYIARLLFCRHNETFLSLELTLDYQLSQNLWNSWKVVRLKHAKMYFIIFQPQYMLKLCLTFNKSQPIYAYKSCFNKKSVTIKREQNQPTNFSQNNSLSLFWIQPLVLGPLLCICFYWNYST